MRDTWPLLERIEFPALRRSQLDTLQVNVGYRCNQSCTHCHVNAGPSRTEEMPSDVADMALAFLARRHITTLDITGGAPELNAHFRRLVTGARDMGVRVMDRCNLTVLEAPGQEDLPEFLRDRQVEIVASMPCYLEDNVDRQRGKGVFDGSIRGLRRLNALGYGREDSGLVLDLVYNPQGASLPPAQDGLEADYKRMLGERYGVVFNRLYTLANMPIQRFGAILIAQGQFERYLGLLRAAHADANLDHVMCRNLISVDWRGYVYDCDFNQMLDLPLRFAGRERVRLSDLLDAELDGYADPGRRPLLWLHRGPRIKLRRRAQGRGRVSPVRLPAPPLQAPEPADRAGRMCPVDYRYSASVLDRPAELTADVLYVAGGLYGNLAALAEIERLAAREDAQVVFNGDFHWFDAEPDWFAEIAQRVARHHAIRGNVETELARRSDIGAGCGCAYPASVDEDTVRRSNEILIDLRGTASQLPGAVNGLASAGDASGRRCRRAPHRYRAWRCDRARRLVVRTGRTRSYRHAGPARSDPAGIARRRFRLHTYLPVGVARLSASVRTHDGGQQWRGRYAELSPEPALASSPASAGRPRRTRRSMGSSVTACTSTPFRWRMTMIASFGISSRVGQRAARRTTPMSNGSCRALAMRSRRRNQPLPCPCDRRHLKACRTGPGSLVDWLGP